MSFENISPVQNKNVNHSSVTQQLLLILRQNTGCSSLSLFPDHLETISSMFSLLYVCFYSVFQFEYSLFGMVKGVLDRVFIGGYIQGDF